MSEFQSERKMFNRWAIWCLRGDNHLLMRLCGLSWAGSPRTVMSELWFRGAVAEADVTGYAAEIAPVPDEESVQVDRFMTEINARLPAVHVALMARHRRMIHGELILTRPEWWIACALYCRRRSRSHQMLAEACERGYVELRTWLNSPLAKTG